MKWLYRPLRACSKKKTLGESQNKARLMQFHDLRSAECDCCRSRRARSNAVVVAEIGVDTIESWAPEIYRYEIHICRYWGTAWLRTGISHTKGSTSGGSVSASAIARLRLWRLPRKCWSWSRRLREMTLHTRHRYGTSISCPSRESAAESCGASNLTAALLLSYTKHCERVGQTDNESVHEEGWIKWLPSIQPRTPFSIPPCNLVFVSFPVEMSDKFASQPGRARYRLGAVEADRRKIPRPAASKKACPVERKACPV